MGTAAVSGLGGEVVLFLLGYKGWKFLLELSSSPWQALFPEVEWTGRGKSQGLQKCYCCNKDVGRCRLSAGALGGGLSWVWW